MKTNHEIVAATASQPFGNSRAKSGGEMRRRINSMPPSLIGPTRTLELAGADLGYGHLILDQLMLYEWIIEDGEARRAASRLLEFLVPHLHPDMTVSAEGGTCRNQYVGQIGFLLLREDRSARAVVAALSSMETPPGASIAISATTCASHAGRSIRFWHTFCARCRRLALERCVRLLSSGMDGSPGGRFSPYHWGDLHVYFPAAGGGLPASIKAIG